MKRLIVIVGLLTLAACGVNPTDATRVLKSQGLSNVKIGGYAWFGCSKGDDFASNFTATDANGKSVEGVVCGGFFKGYTVRYW